MMIKNIYRLMLLISVSLVCNNCVDEFEFGTQNFEDILVIESTITDELKFQEVLISRTFRLENDGPLAESNATVSIVDDQQVEYSFNETEPGKYVSANMFEAQVGRSYQLQITTNDGMSYSSRSSILPQKAQIDNLYAERVINDAGVEGIGIFVDSFDPTGNANFYRYKFDETYQIIPPFWAPIDIEIVSDNPPEVAIVPRVREERVCYKTVPSNNIILTSTNNLTENRVDRFMVHFIESDNVALRDRYSILVEQLIQTSEAQEFYSTLKDFSDSESLFSQVQPGFINGNIFSVNTPNENVLGFFEVVSVSSERIFVNLKDFIPSAVRPEFDGNCTAGSLFVETNVAIIIDLVRRRGMRLAAFDGFTEEYTLTIPVCTDCTVSGTNIRPDFWED
ncbi:DUF4249 domain-containing protein [Aquimarina sp. AU474]|uniref:DUF4249 domain-containing protein n=1 Tax=Aquimarina sp. AU474 TaxID=2108529 RepID=UPI000D6961DA|nr:DUF4249 domain-containing protein [Aquimarina sp. AU474]